MSMKKPEVGDIPEIQRRPGAELSLRGGEGEEGAYGCLVEDEDTQRQYILTCAHVVLGGSAVDLKGIVADGDEYKIRVRGVGKSYTIGELYYSRRDEHNDTALILPYKDNNTNRIGEYEIGKEREIISEEDRGATVSFMSSVTDELQIGQVHTARCVEPVKLKYLRVVVEFLDVIKIGRNMGQYWRTISEPGDSGSVIFDENNRAIGLLIGGDRQFTYALPIYPILKQAGVTIA